MQIKRIKILKYKKLLNVDLNLEKDITLIAGPNNSGKTSIVEVLKFLFTDTKDKIELSELNTKLVDEWLKKFYMNLKNILKRNIDDEKLPEELTIFFRDNPINDNDIMPTIHIEVTYDKKNDNLTDVIRYAYELDDSNSIYFKYKCKLNEEKLKKN